MTAEQIDPIDQTDDEPKEECGVFGVWAPGEDVAKLSYYGLYALQHRGQEAAGIAVAGPMALHLLRGQPPAAALRNGSPEPGRTQLGVCLNYLPGSPERCVARSCCGCPTRAR